MSAPIRTVVIPTNGRRPALLSRCLDTLVAAAEFHEHPVELVVACNGDAADELTTRDVLRQYWRPGIRGVRYIGRADAARFANALVDDIGGADAELAALTHALLFVGNDAAPRNLLQLDQVGEVFLSVDDDIIPLVWAAAEARLGGEPREFIGYDPTELTLFPTRADALRVNEDGAILGFSPFHIFPELGRDVRVMQGGLAGDPGMPASPYLLRHPSPATRRRLRDAYDRGAPRWRNVRRHVTQPTLAAGDFFQSGFFACDGVELLPPWLPLGRGADALFAQTLRASCLSLIGHTPHSILHIPDDAREPLLADLEPANHLAHLVGLAIRAWPRPSSTDHAWRMRALGDYLASFADDPDFDRAFEKLRHAAIAAALESLECKFADDVQGSPPPPRYAQDVEDSRQLHIDALDGPAPPSLYIEARSAIRATARLLALWPDVDASARRLRVRGIRPALEEPPF